VALKKGDELIYFKNNQKEESKKCRYFNILLFLILLIAGCSKNSDKVSSPITGSVIEDLNENCRFANESDCRPIEIRKGEDEKSSEAEGQMSVNKTSDAKKTELTVCSEGWQCVEKNYRAYQYSNCSWVSVEYCVYGCRDGICSGAPICKPNSLKCDNDNVAKCSEDGSEWKQNESCDYLCENGVCINKTSNSVNSTNSTNDNSSTQEICDNNCISITNFHYNAGNDCNNLNNEYVTFQNNCTYSCDLTNWNVSDASSHSYRFPSFVLGNGDLFTLYTGNGTNTQTELYWNSKYTPCPAIWNNNGDTLYLRNSTGNIIITYTY